MSEIHDVHQPRALSCWQHGPCHRQSYKPKRLSYHGNFEQYDIL